MADLTQISLSSLLSTWADLNKGTIALDWQVCWSVEIWAKRDSKYWSSVGEKLTGARVMEERE